MARTQERDAARPSTRTAQLTIVPLRDFGAAPRPAAPAPTRNPFAFGRAPIASPDSDAAIAATPPLAPPVQDEAASIAGPEWRLVGVAVDAEGIVTAIVSGAGDVHLVRTGDRLPGEVTVTEVTSAGVHLERADGTTLDLRLP